MWKIIKSELEYGMVKFLAFMAAVPLLVYTEYHFENFVKIYIALILHFVLLTWFLSRSKERRELRLNILPVSNFRIALSRILMIVFLTVSLYTLYYGLYYFLGLSELVDPKYLFLSAIVLMIVFIITLIIRDTAFEYFQRIGLNKYKVKLVLMIIILALNMVTLYAFVYTKSHGKAPSFFEFSIRFIENHNPFSTAHSVEYFSILLIGCMVLSMFTYKKRSSYLK